MRSGRPLVPFELSEPTRKQLQSLANSRSTPHGLVRRAEIVLLAADGWPNQAIASCLSTSPATVGKWRKRFVEQGLMGLYDELRPGTPRSIDDEQVAAVVYKTLNEKPEHQTQWTVRSMAAAVASPPPVAAAGRVASDLVNRVFWASGPNQLWIADLAYIPTRLGFLYLSVVMDAWSRRMVGWAMANHLRTQLVLDALDMALHRRRPKKVIHHSDHGSQYTALPFGQRCRQAGVRPSMGSVGDCFDNALCESFFATLDRELLDRHRFATQSQAQLTVFEYMEGWYNPHRRHSGQRSPINYERYHLSRGINPNGKLSVKSR